MLVEINPDSLEFFQALSSGTRLKIIRMIAEHPMNVKEISEELGISSAIVTKHIKQLENAGIVKSETVPAVRGKQKLCALGIEQAELRFLRPKQPENYYRTGIPIGQYSRFDVRPTCGLAGAERLIGVVDDPRYFAEPEHVMASMLWFGSGWIEYVFPNYLLRNQRLSSLQISLEICSEAPGYNENWPSDISFEINGVRIGKWTSPGDFGAVRGILTPAWWNYGTEYGLLKTISVNGNGSYLDGMKISDVSAAQLSFEKLRTVTFRVLNEEDAVNRGGVSIFGKHFGNYAQDINITMGFEQLG